MADWYQKTGAEALSAFDVTTDGLSSEQAAERLKKNGENVLAEGKKKTVLQVFLGQFADLLVLILIAAAIISMFSGNIESTIVIFAVIIMNAILGTAQHVKAEKSLDSLKSLSSPSAKVIRDGQKLEIDSKKVVAGDIIVLEAGDLVVADGRIIHNYSLQVNESSLTGESTNVDKNDETISGETPLGDRTNMVFSGSLVTYGRALVLVTETGMNTEIGRIASLMNAAKEKKTPLQQSLDKFSGRLAVIIMVICAVVFGLSLWQGKTIIDSLMFAVALAVAAIPEALSSIVTIVQAMGTQKMAKENAVIKDLKAVESLGCVSVICSDKTGTLTQNKMTVQRIYINGESIREEELDIRLESHRRLIYDMVLNNDSSIVDGKGIGDPTEYALIETSRSIGLDENIIRDTLGRVEEVPFDSDRKMMSTKYKLHGVPHILTKGALDSILDRCVSIATKDGVRPITDEDKNIILKQNNDYSEAGLRVLTFAYKESDEALSVETEYNYTFLGLVAMIDPPREESKAAVADAIRAGIKPIMITGDHKITASAIAKQIGIMRDGDMAVTGMELDTMDDAELDRVLEKISVYARVSPENKIRIVEAWQRKGNIVSMTGDGVNDAPALKKADIGVAMGITGTEVSKDAASMILQDDNFATIIKAVANGRNVYRNIRNSILFLLSGNMAAIITVLFTSIMALPVPFEPVHLLFINLLTDSLPALAIGMEKPEHGLLSQKPRDPNKGILTKDFTALMFGQGALIAVVVVTAFYLGLPYGAATAATMAFATLTLARLFHGFNCRSKRSIFSLGLLSNLYSVGAFVLGCLLLALVLFVPALHSLFCVEAMDGMMYACIALLAFAPTVVIQIIKVILDKVRKTS
ncbi:cation-translocating P-type ATPase [Ruminococcus sp.]|uniref:cation-translocating P-type ATPase n=1 Tax=Ruminococcus sp. TaxID=41978 RepID=UPI002E777FC6|nr:cation-translocating P-type ATPase [Ruminococcus sp.]MEE1262855.1 cation-translocating P-type ATPase [Ruminococcus sp.]